MKYTSIRPIRKARISHSFIYKGSGITTSFSQSAEANVIMGDGKVGQVEEIIDHFNPAPTINRYKEKFGVGEPIELYLEPNQKFTLEIGKSYNVDQFLSAPLRMIEIESDVFTGWIKLSENRVLLDWDDESAPQLKFINSFCAQPLHFFEKVQAKNYNLPRGEFSLIRGNFFTNQKGTAFFEYDPDGPHELIKDEWNNQRVISPKYYGHNLPKLATLHHHRYESEYDYGNEYVVIKKGEIYSPSLEDL